MNDPKTLFQPNQAEYWKKSFYVSSYGLFPSFIQISDKYFRIHASHDSDVSKVLKEIFASMGMN